MFLLYLFKIQCLSKEGKGNKTKQNKTKQKKQTKNKNIKQKTKNKKQKTNNKKQKTLCWRIYSHIRYNHTGNYRSFNTSKATNTNTHNCITFQIISRRYCYRVSISHSFITTLFFFYICTDETKSALLNMSPRLTTLTTIFFKPTTTISNIVCLKNNFSGTWPYMYTTSSYTGLHVHGTGSWDNRICTILAPYKNNLSVYYASKPVKRVFFLPSCNDGVGAWS